MRRNEQIADEIHEQFWSSLNSHLFGTGRPEKGRHPEIVTISRNSHHSGSGYVDVSPGEGPRFHAGAVHPGDCDGGRVQLRLEDDQVARLQWIDPQRGPSMDLGGGWETERVLKTNHIVGIGFLRRKKG